MRSFVVTGGGRGIGRAIADRLLHDGAVVVLEADAEAAARLPAGLHAVIGDAADAVGVRRAAEAACDLAPLAGWVNNAVVFRDAVLHRDDDVADLVLRNLAPAVVGSGEALRRFLAQGSGGALVNVSSHQAARPVRGASAYATAKAAIEGLTRATAVDYGPAGIRANAVALGSIETERSRRHVDDLGADGAAFLSAVAQLHPLGRAGTPDEVADAVAFLLSDAAAFVNGVVLPVDGGRAVYGPDPEEHRVD